MPLTLVETPVCCTPVVGLYKNIFYLIVASVMDSFEPTKWKIFHSINFMIDTPERVIVEVSACKN